MLCQWESCWRFSASFGRFLSRSWFSGDCGAFSCHMRSVVAVNFCDTHFCGNIVQWISARRWLIEQSAPSRVPLAQPVMSHEEFLCCEVCVWQADLIIANEKKNWEEATFWQAQSIFYDLSQHIKILLHFEMLIGRPAFDFSAKIDDVWTGFFFHRLFVIASFLARKILRFA